MRQVTPPTAYKKLPGVPRRAPDVRPSRPTSAAQYDPAPSRWSYRFQRLMLTPLFRRTLRAGVPFCLAFGLGSAYLADEARQQAMWLKLSELRHQIETRPEFMVSLLSIEGASPVVEADIRGFFPYELPASSFDLNLDHVREMIIGLAPVTDASLHVRQGGVLEITVSERRPTALWRARDGLKIVDESGVVIRHAGPRADWPNLPVLAGEGANTAIPEAMNLLEIAAPLEARMRGLVRVGGRRWDVVLQGNQRIMLPEQDPQQALERVIALDQAQDMLARDLVVVDMRLAERPTIRMSSSAIDEWWRVTNFKTNTQAESQ